jgi:hypothetical protein
MYPLSQTTVITEGSGLTAAGTGTITGNIVDMAGFNGIMFTVQCGTVVAGGTVTVASEGAATSGGSTSVEATTGPLTPAANGLIVLDVLKPTNRFQNPTVVIASENVQILSVTTTRYQAGTLPTTPDSSAQTTTAIVN